MKIMPSLNNKPIILFDIDYTLFDTALFKKSNLAKFSLYEEVLDTLTTLSNKFTLGIFSQGEKDFQEKKLRETKIAAFFSKEHIHIDPQKEGIIKEIMEKYKNTSLIFIDDKLPLLSLAKNHNSHAFTVWVKRGEYAENQQPLPDFTPDANIDNLSEIIPLLSMRYGFTLHSH